MHLTEQQIRETVAAMRMSDETKRVIISQCLANVASARFVVFNAWMRAGAR